MYAEAVGTKMFCKPARNDIELLHPIKFCSIFSDQKIILLNFSLLMLHDSTTIDQTIVHAMVDFVFFTAQEIQEY